MGMVHLDVKFIKYLILLLLISSFSYADDSEKFWDQECLKKELKQCGNKSLPKDGTLTEEQRKILICRIKALVKCRKDEN